MGRVVSTPFRKGGAEPPSKENRLSLRVVRAQCRAGKPHVWLKKGNAGLCVGTKDKGSAWISQTLDKKARAGGDVKRSLKITKIQNASWFDLLDTSPIVAM